MDFLIAIIVEQHVVLYLIAATAVVFMAWFVVPAWFRQKKLTRAIRALQQISNSADGRKAVTDLESIATKALADSEMSHLWSEYTETLHPQRELRDSGDYVISRFRATTLSETFFTDQVLVDIPLKTDFYKHLPGILTGLGIIGTFFGLIKALKDFSTKLIPPGTGQLVQQTAEQISLKAAEVQGALGSLIGGVSEAFVVSAVAISLAMFFTWVEKYFVTKGYRLVSQLRQEIDAMFDAGAGEEYLERLVVAAETQATQAMQIKDALVTELNVVMAKMTDRLVDVQARQSEQAVVLKDAMISELQRMLEKQSDDQKQLSGVMAGEVGRSISENLGTPMREIGEAVKAATGNQGEAVHKLLSEVLKDFAAQIRDLFGGQITGINDLLSETTTTLRETALEFGKLAKGMDSAGESAIDKMVQRLDIAMASMENRQKTMDLQMQDFVGRLKNLLLSSQTETSAEIQKSLASMTEQVTAMVVQLKDQTKEATSAHESRQMQLEAEAQRSADSLSGQIEKLLQESSDASRVMKDAIDRMATTTTNAIAQLNQGAETLFVAASDFAKAGQGVADTMRASTTTSQSLRDSATSLSSATAATRDILTDHARTRDSFAQLVNAMDSIVANARKEAGLSAQVVATLEKAATQLIEAQKQADEYLQSINQVLGEAHKGFADNTLRTMQEANRKFLEGFQNSIGLLASGVENLGEFLENLPEREK